MSTHVLHVITPGDHFSPQTGSAIPTVVHGLAGAAQAAGADRPSVLVARGTYENRYSSADVIEYESAGLPARTARVQDAVRGALGMPRTATERSFAPVAAALRHTEPGIVIAHNAPILARLLRDDPAHPVVVYAHNALFRTYSRHELASALRNVAAVVCVSDDLAARTRTQLPRGMASRVHTVPNGVDTELFYPAPEANTVPRAHPLRVAFVGRVVPEKGVDVLLEAAARITFPHAEFVVVGSSGFDASAPLTPHEQRLRSRAARIRTPIRFLPFVERHEVAALLRTCDVMVVPSRWAEPYALTVVEGMASGLPVVASRTGGIPEAIGDAGVLVPPGDPTALANAIDHLLSDDEARRSLGVAARVRATARDWSWAWGLLAAVIDAL